MNTATITPVLEPVSAPPGYRPQLGTLSGQTRGLAIALLIIVGVLIPFVVGDYRLFQANQVLIFAVAILGLNLLTGYNGQISVGHSAFLAMGAYGTAILTSQFGVHYGLAIPLSGLICLVFGFLFGFPALRLQGFYLALATFSLAVALPQMLRYRGIEHWTGGVQGLFMDQPAPPAFLPITSDQWVYFVTLFATILLFWAAWNLVRGPMGRAIIALRDHEVAGEVMGIRAGIVKSLTFGISGMYTGIAGGLSALSIQFVAPDSFHMFVSVTLLVGAVVGGVATIWGAFLGALFVVFVPNISETISESATWAVYGAFLLLVIYLMPNGMAGGLEELYRKLRARTTSAPAQN